MMDKFLWIAVALIIVWVIAGITKFVAGLLLNLLWMAAIVFFIIWLVKKVF